MGFKYNSLAFIWNKISKHKEGILRTTLTPYTRRSCEYCFMGTRGKVKNMLKDRYVLQYVPLASQTRKHSLKPDEVRKRIVRLCGDLPRIELFSRENIEGWDAWGNQVKDSIILDNN